MGIIEGIKPDFPHQTISPRNEKRNRNSRTFPITDSLTKFAGLWGMIYICGCKWSQSIGALCLTRNDRYRIDKKAKIMFALNKI